MSMNILIQDFPVTSNVIKEFLQNDQFVMWALRQMLNRQTNEELKSNQTIESNGRGFNRFDAELLSSFAGQVARTGWLSVKQLEIARRRLVKYTNQLIQEVYIAREFQPHQENK